MKVFRINDYWWWMAPTLEQAVADAIAFNQTLGNNEPDDEFIDRPKELDDAAMQRHRFFDDRNPQTGERSFADELKRRIKAGAKSEMFATSEY